MDADTALAGGLIRSIHAPEDLLPDAIALARKLTDNRSPVALALARQMLYHNSAQAHPLAAHQSDSLAMFYTSIADGKEGVQAFLDKRAPVFTGQVPRDLPTVF